MILECEEKWIFVNFFVCVNLKKWIFVFVEMDMVLKKVKEIDILFVCFIFWNFINELVCLVLYVICSFYLFLVCFMGKGIYIVF